LPKESDFLKKTKYEVLIPEISSFSVSVQKPVVYCLIRKWEESKISRKSIEILPGEINLVLVYFIKNH
jgi:hypothetical protein